MTTTGAANELSTGINVSVNGANHVVSSDPRGRLSGLLRDELGLTGTKIGCDAGDCGACTVLVNDAPVCACLTPVGSIANATVESVESLSCPSAEHGDLGVALARSFALAGAAQCGFCTPGMLMAALGLLRSNPNPSRDEVVEGLAGVLCRCTGYQKIIDAVVDYRTVAAPMEPTVGKAVGHRIPRVDADHKVDGSEQFGADAIPDDALRLQIVRSPHNSASFVIGDLDSYIAADCAITTVLTAADIPGQNGFGVIAGFEDQPALAEGHTRFFGEAVAVIVGEGIDASALDNFPIMWTERSASLQPVESLAPEAHALHDHAPDNVLIRGRVQREAGSEDGADVVATVTGTFTTSFVEHAYIEPEAGWAELVDGQLTIHATTQAPYMDRAATAQILGMAEEELRIVPTGCGGGFGGKLDISIQPLLGLATLRTGLPTSIVYNRPESIISTTKRHPAEMTVAVSASADGRLREFEFDGTFNTGAYASWGPTVANRVPIHAGGPYRHGDYQANSTAVYTNCAPAGAFRGFGVPQAAIARELLFDELADELGIDRLTFRETNALRAGQPTNTGQVFEAGVGISDCLAALREPWEDAKHRAATRNAVTSDTKRGVGIAAAWYGCGNTALPNPSTVRIGLRADGTFVLHQGATDIGQGSNTVMTQIAADALGVAVSRITRVGPDTSVTPDAGKTSASRQTYVSGNATYLAATSLRNQVLDAAGVVDDDRVDAQIDCGPDGLGVLVRGQRCELADTSLVEVEGPYVVMAEETYDPPTVTLDENGQGVPYAVFGFGVQLVEVDVDTATGRTIVVNVVAAFDVGRAVNPTLVEGQIEGGIAQGLGLALMEEFHPGRPGNLHDYLMPTMGDMPPVTSILVESTDPLGPYGAKGIGEHALIPTAPAILNAIRDACGARIRHVPATPEVVLRAIRDSNQ